MYKVIAVQKRKSGAVKLCQRHWRDVHARLVAFSGVGAQPRGAAFLIWINAGHKSLPLTLWRRAYAIAFNYTR